MEARSGVMILETLKRWLHWPADSGFDGTHMQQWADQRQFVWRDVRDAPGFVIEGRQGTLPWRMEWGAPQRAYFHGNELRLRADVAVPAELHALLITRRLQERLEAEVFDHFVGDLQTRVDTRVPPEVRWLMIYSPVPAGSHLPLKERWTAVSNVKPWMDAWLSSPLGKELMHSSHATEEPSVLMIARSRLTLRTQMAHPDVAQIDSAVRLFETALREARRAASTGCESREGEATQPGMFTPVTSAIPERDTEHVDLH
jgi:hypothetical protein